MQGYDLILDFEVGGESLRFAFDFKALDKYNSLNPPLLDRKLSDNEATRNQELNLIGQRIMLYALAATLYSGTGVLLNNEEVLELREALTDEQFGQIQKYWLMATTGTNLDGVFPKKKGLSFADKLKKTD